MKNERIVLFDLDGTLCDYNLGLKHSMVLLESPNERDFPDEPAFKGVPRDDAPAYLRARANLIRSTVDWWADLPKFKLGFVIWDLAGTLEYRKMILTQGPRRNANAWTGKKLWIDKNLGQDVDITITRDKGLVYGKVLVDDWFRLSRSWPAAWERAWDAP